MIPNVSFIDQEGRNPLRRNDRTRALRIFLDPSVLLEVDDNRDQSALLLELIEETRRSRHIEYFTLSNVDGNDSGIQNVNIPNAQGDALVAAYADDNWRTTLHLGSRANIEQRAQFEASRSNDATESQWYDSLLLRRLADQLGADILATNRKATLLTHRGPKRVSRACLSPHETIAVASLVLRHHESWVNAWPKRIDYPSGEWLARRVVVLDKIFGRERSSSLMKFHALGALSAVPYIADRSESMIQRVSTAIAIRDVISIESMKPPNNDGMDRLAAHIEWLCLTLSGAFDAFALIINSLLSRPLSSKATSWTERRWRLEARSQFPEYFDIVDRASVVSLLNLCKRLRDTIRSVAPGSTLYSGPETDGTVTYVVVPSEKSRGFYASCTSVGGASEDWGVVMFGDEILIDPMIFTGRLFDAALNSLRQVVTRFPWHMFPPLALPPSPSPKIAAMYSAGIDFMYAGYGLSKTDSYSFCSLERANATTIAGE